jgi:hypothetical protein
MAVNLNLSNKKLELIQWLSTIEDPKIIDKIMDLIQKENLDWWNSLSHNERESITAGIDDADSGMLNPHSKARKLYEKWL